MLERLLVKFVSNYRDECALGSMLIKLKTCDRLECITNGFFGNEI